MYQNARARAKCHDLRHLETEHLLWSTKKKSWEDSIETMHKEHDKTVSENEIAMHKLISTFKTQMEKQALDAKTVEQKQQQQINALTMKIKTLNQQHNQQITLFEQEKQQLANKAATEAKSLQDAHKELMQQHQSDIGHLLSQHKKELEKKRSNNY